MANHGYGGRKSMSPRNEPDGRRSGSAGRPDGRRDSDGAFIDVRGLTRDFDVSRPLLSRLIEGTGRTILRAVDHVGFSIGRGRTFSLVGESGCGKSTVAKMLVGLLKPGAGSIRFEGTDLVALRNRADLRSLRKRMQMIFQDPYASLNPRWRIADIIAEPLIEHGLAAGRREIAHRVDELLEQVRLSPQDGRRYPHEFSGGQRQRVCIARALASRPEFLVCDEPTSALDVSVQAQILNLIKDLQRDLRLTCLFISHDLAVVHHVSDDLGVMYLGRLVEQGAAREIFREPRHPYTRMLLDAIPDIGMTDRPRLPVAGEVPSPIRPPAGCHFHPRCPLAHDRCRREIPEITPTAAGWVRCHAARAERPGDFPAGGATDRPATRPSMQLG